MVGMIVDCEGRNERVMIIVAIMVWYGIVW